VTDIEEFLTEKHGELYDYLSENLSYEQSEKDAKIYSYKLGQLDLITELSRKIDLRLDR
jgi:hypothetical protein